MKIKILLIGDSFGCERYYDKNNIVLKNETWPELVKVHFSNHLEIDSNFKPFRLLEEVIDVVNNNKKKYNFIIIHAGIVDIFPRPLPKKIFRSRKIFARVLRKIIGTFRYFWLKNIYAKPMNSIEFLDKELNNLINNHLHTKFVFVNVSKQFHKEAIKTPNVVSAIDSFNEMIRLKSLYSKKFEFIDLNSYDSAIYYSSVDSHFNKEGNNLMFKLISTYIEKECLQKV